MPGYERPVPYDTATTAPAPPKPLGAEPIRIDSQITPITKAAQAIENALTTFEDAWADIANAEDRGQLTMEGRAARVAHADQSGAVDAAMAAAHARATEADQAYTAARQALTPSHSDAVAALRANAFWQSVCRELDSVKPTQLVARVQQLVADAKPDELAVLAEELPSFLRSKSVDASWMDQALEAASPALKTAATRSKLAHQAYAVVSSNGRSAKRAMRSAGNGSYRRPRLVDVSAFDPDA
jgi:hypothetical protein